MLSTRSHNVLTQLLGREKYGLELVADSGGVLKRTSIYVLLGRLEDQGLIEGAESPVPPGKTGPARRVYRVTADGRRRLAAHEAAEAIMAAG